MARRPLTSSIKRRRERRQLAATALGTLSLSASTIAENSAAATVVGSIVGKTAGSTLSLTDSAGSRFSLNGLNQIVAGSVATNYEGATTHNITVRETLVGAYSSPHDSVIAITVTNVLEVALAALTLSASTVAENTAAATVVGAIQGKSSGSSLSLTDTAGNRFAISGTNLVTGATATNFESATSHSITIRETHADGSNSPRDTILSITVTNVNEAPTDIALSASTVAEDAALGTVVGALTRTDPDAGGSVTYSLTSDASGTFGISGTNLIVTGVLDFETTPSPSVTVRATDQGGLTYDEAFSLTVTNVAETPPADALPTNGTTTDDGTFTNGPFVTSAHGSIKLSGKKASGAGKFLYSIGAPTNGYKYTAQYDPDFTLLANTGKDSFVGFGFKNAGNAYELIGLKGDGSTGLDVTKISGANITSTAASTITTVNAADYGTQAGPNWIQIELSGDGTTYTFRTSTDGVTWVDETTGSVPASATAIGIAGYFPATDTGPFSIAISTWTSGLAGDPYFASVVLLTGFENSVDGSNNTTDEKSGRTITLVGNNATAAIITSGALIGSKSWQITNVAGGTYATCVDSNDWTPVSGGGYTGEITVKFDDAMTGRDFGIISHWSSGWALWRTGGNLAFRYVDAGSVQRDVTGPAFTPVVGQTYKFAFDVDASNKLRAYKDGVMIFSQTGVTFANAAAVLALGGVSGFALSIKGVLDEARITKGVARYASDGGYTPITTAFPRS